jgi:peroxiredoxin
MLWVRFDEQDRQIRSPHFCLNSIIGGQVCMQDFYELSNLVVVFLHDINCPDCQRVSADFVRQEDAYQNHQSRVLLIFPQTLQEIRLALQWNATLLKSLEKSSIHLLSDPGKYTRQSYARLMSASLTGEDDTILFVLDSYGSPYTAVIARELDDPEIHSEILSWLQYIEIQCPE